MGLKKITTNLVDCFWWRWDLTTTSIHKHLGMILKLLGMILVDLNTIHKHIRFKVKIWRTFTVSLKKNIWIIGLIWKFQRILPRTCLITIYKSFARPHLDCGYKMYYQTFSESVHQRIEPIQCNSAIPITGAIRGTFSEKHYQELGLESLRSIIRLKKLCLFYKIYKNKPSPYLYNLILTVWSFILLERDKSIIFPKLILFFFFNNWME